ncbi:MAG TPA: DUF1009 domain-containing protein [Rhodospirillaceae bacterium]|nr:UDP-2,3-diacylglucosamine pyrophosphatase [Alphaproteobacteria bacterium]OUT42308.1 MAG: hypothetical protein CBB62_08515 [Micavibrio sp. TMED2]HCI45781.1 DUF1009 domain-containing protein [Rhodospirillaceae bacterium]MAS46058.1 UDP-2,3-diacylglucosamine pyrophosphatase [Alphaproteobacteria bacterium]MAX95760.1 UDP-2,3-diacylglucosamine pyrophosphatase [Alphaproteobacteria bacterium]|tara:strand:- start:11048 stop:11905 length:858 start_codon:yes stop_codon:yes gene_type:complete
MGTAAVDTSRKLGVVAGGGALPSLVINEARKQGREVFVLALEHFVDLDLIPDGVDYDIVPLGAAAKLIGSLRKAGVQDVVMAGRVKRPGLRELKPDFKALAILTKASIRGLGDDGLLSAVRKEIEAEGFRLIGVPDVMPDILAGQGLLAGAQPDEQAMHDIRRGVAVLNAISQVDVGQAVTVQQGIVLAIEAVEGTDAMIARAGELRREGIGGVLVKLVKEQQDRSLDLPTIGLETVQKVAEAGLRGIAVSAGSCQIIDTDAVYSAVKQHNLFLIGIDPASMVAP